MFKIEDFENIYHVTWVTHNSFISERMVFYKIKIGEPIILSKQDIKLISFFIKRIAIENKYKIIEFKVNSNHVHLIIICRKIDRDEIIKTTKSKTTYLYKINHCIKDRFHLWGQKYNSSLVKSNEELMNVINYVRNNHLKHEKNDT